MALLWVALRLREHIRMDGDGPKYETSTMDMLLLGSLAVVAVLYLLYQERARLMPAKKVFPFMKLPPELRARVLSYLVEPPVRPAPVPFDALAVRTNIAIRLSTSYMSFREFITSGKTVTEYVARFEESTKSMLKTRGYDWDKVAAEFEVQKRRHRLQSHPICKHLNVMRLVNKKFSADFLDVFLKNKEPVFTIEASSSPDGSHFGPWQTSLHLVKKCTVWLVARPSIADAIDPRQARTENWLRPEPIMASFQQMTNLKSLTLVIEARTNRHWNPIWLWFFASQAFKQSEVRPFNRIEFAMIEHRAPRPNHLQRALDGDEWEWRCMNDHVIATDETGIPIRKFCGRLYHMCKRCEEPHEDTTDSEDDESELLA